MGYRIRYGPEPEFERQPPKSRLQVLTAGFALAFVMLVRLLWPQGADLLRDVLLPGEDVTTAAFTQMAADIQAGEDVADAVTAFCRSVVADAFAQ